MSSASNSLNRTIHQCAAAGDLDGVLAFIKKGATNAVDDNGRSPLFLACEAGHDKCVDALIRAGSNVNMPCAFGSTPLTMAVVHKIVNKDEALLCVKLLVEGNADVNLKTSIGNISWHNKTPMSVASSPVGYDRDIWVVLYSAGGTLATNSEHIKSIPDADVRDIVMSNSLNNIARDSVRSIISDASGSSNFLSAIKTLPLPDILKDYLVYKGEF